MQGRLSSYPEESAQPIYLQQQPDAHAVHTDMNSVMQSVLKTYQPQLKKRFAALRCEALPLVAAPALPVRKLIENIIQIILWQPAVGSQLFLHVSWARHGADVMNLSLPAAPLFSICFQTNIALEDEWSDDSKKLYTECAALAENLHGKFIIQHHKTSGCSLCVQLPGVSNS